MKMSGLPPGGPAWSRVGVGSAAMAAADRDALGTTARIVVWPPEHLPRLLRVVDRELARLDQQASRFRRDSEISALHELVRRDAAGRASSQGGYIISDGLAEAIRIALAAAKWTSGMTDPTVGGALISLGYDRDFAAIQPSPYPPALAAVPGWHAVRLAGNLLTLPAGVRLDLGATAKGLGADRAARAAYAAAGGPDPGTLGAGSRGLPHGGVLVSLGGDLAVAGQPPAGGWPVLIADEHRQVRAARNQAAPRPVSGWADPVASQQIRLSRGGLATSSITARQWLRAGQVVHHLIDPRTGRPADGPWRTVSVAAASCAEANAAATAAIVAGAGAIEWLTAQGLPARLIGWAGEIEVTCGWPEAEGGQVDPPVAGLLDAIATDMAGSGP